MLHVHHDALLHVDKCLHVHHDALLHVDKCLHVHHDALLHVDKCLHVHHDALLHVELPHNDSTAAQTVPLLLHSACGEPRHSSIRYPLVEFPVGDLCTKFSSPTQNAPVNRKLTFNPLRAAQCFSALCPFVGMMHECSPGE